MKNRSQTIRKIVGYLNNPEEDGGFWLPNIQRPFVWTEEQICRLFDSILREYPISTLLIWKTTSGIRRRKFIDNYKPSLRLSDYFVPVDERKKCLVLDGQQRLQSLFIGLCGSYAGRELYLDILSGELAAPDDIRYKFAFLEEEDAAFPWVRFKDLIFTTLKKRQIVEDLIEQEELSSAQEDRIGDHLDLIDRTFKMDEAITYQELDSIDNPSLYTEDDVVEVFIRANSGGTRLGKSDLLFSLLSASWDTANDRMDELLDAINKHGFAFNRDFVLKTCLVLFDQGARYAVEKFRKPGVREKIEDQWNLIASAIREVHDFVREKTFIRCDQALPSYLVLIPLVYLRFHFPETWRRAAGRDEYVLRTSLTGAFSGQPDTVIDALARHIKETGAFDLTQVYGIIRSANRSLEITEDRLWQMGYGSDAIHLLFNLWYREFNYTPAYDNNLPQIDHIFPQKALKSVREGSPEPGQPRRMRYAKSARDQLANCMLLTREENGSSGKGDTLPEEWFSDKDAAYLDLHLIPKDRSLWKLERFEDFIAARKNLIREKFRSLLVAAAVTEPR